MLYTIGHGATTVDDLLRRLESHGVRMVLDVRSQPYSRHPQFNKAELEAELAADGIGYRWLGVHLGGKPLRPGAAAPVDDPVLLEAGITEAAGLAAGATGALLCAELDPVHCHRATVLAPRFAAARFTVMHIYADGTAAPHQPSLDV
ncbi:MAG: DUF488 domain-containing protein [Acidimicrobiia bacterium]|nr:DUF488 domain-containing protein [Acidimicrobiia bacterium]NNF09555.1 DUF488 domain-containing protein [Acidimicrobiia bacterium]NNL71493.1 DUF488 domain-containing protein [Acidimicrobiia bacterium]